ncbi:hypothetical protein O181_053716 [Austropuccinia psidii MF-1]|uniref:Uncharacterized protein n=1 Tax=Austropuccinia psidii MF-1 TaxID=1389203 RepID=A0A9Q3HQF9_9BASI|nr:hypothetical protein [Austropuccinia psidii MF-1]
MHTVICNFEFNLTGSLLRSCAVDRPCNDSHHHSILENHSSQDDYNLSTDSRNQPNEFGLITRNKSEIVVKVGLRIINILRREDK